MRNRKSHSKVVDNLPAEGLLAPEQWLKALEPRRATKSQLFSSVFGQDSELIRNRLNFYRKVVESAQALQGTSGCFLVRCPARINLMGMHIEHQGGSENPICIPFEHVGAVIPSESEQITVFNTHPAYPARQYKICEIMPRELRCKQWRDYCQENAPIEPGDWGNYVVGAVAQMQRFFPDRKLRGFTMTLGSDIPLAAGLSSSAALVLTVLKAMAAVNELAIGDQVLIGMAGNAELVVGTLGGHGDGSAMVNAQVGRCVHHSFFPYSAYTFDLPSDLGIVLANSFSKAEKQTNAKNAFNERICCYHLGRSIIKDLLSRQDIALDHLGQLIDGTLALKNRQLYKIVKQLPRTISRQQANHVPGDDGAGELEFLFSTHDEPAGGYRVRRRVLFGLAEMDRAKWFVALAKEGHSRELGRLKTIGHNGDRVSWPATNFQTPDHDAYLDYLAINDFPLAYVNGGYQCSTPELDTLVDSTLDLDATFGAGLTGAGLGGCAVVLCEAGHAGQVVDHLRKLYYRPRDLPPDGVQEVRPIKGITVIRSWDVTA